MFEQVMAVPVQTRRAWTTMVGMAGETLLVAAALMAPLISPQLLPHTQLLPQIFAPRAPVAPPPPAPVRVVAVERYTRPLQSFGKTVFMPTSMPPKPVMIDEPPLNPAEIGAMGGVQGGVEGGVPGGVLHGLPAQVAQAVPPPRPAAPAVKAAPAEKPVDAAPQRIRLGGVVQHAKLVRQVMPVYPPLARQARISGVVELMGIIGVDGRIRELQAMKGHPLLVPAALDAVRQWVYQPTHLNGEPVEVIAPITVSFLLNN